MKSCILYDLIKKMINRYIEHDIGQIGGQLAYFSLLSLFPFLIYINKLISFLDFSYAEMMGFLKPLFPDNITALITGYVEYISESETGGWLSVGLIMLIYSASRIVRSMEKSINLAYEVRERRPFIRSIFRSMLFVVCLGIVLLLMAAAALISRGLLEWIFGALGISTDILQGLLLFKWTAFAVIIFMAMSAIYYFMPNKRISYKSTLPGAGMAVAGLALLAVGFSIYVKYGIRYSTFYGTVGAIFLLLIWMYAAGIIIVMGAELNSILMDKEDSHIK